ncbi:MAG: transcription termination factor NusA [Candidatus Cloacimonetes bacterium]|jgi:N utilization substance protein A|nr:transcription termination factor NusA [Candidatus Cloacimonadota bacterium]
MSSNILAIIKELANMKQLDQDKIEKAVTDSLLHVLNKKLKPENELEIIIDYETNYLAARFLKEVVYNDETLGQISLEDATSDYKIDAEIGDTVEVEIPIQKLEPKLIKNAREEITHKIKKLEEDRKMFDYEKQKNQIVYGKIKKSDYNGYIVDIGFAEGLLPVEEQVDDEFYKVGDHVRCFVLNIRKRGNELIVILSRAHPEFVKKLLELEVPEILSGDIEIKKIIREPGIRTKVAVKSIKNSVDAVGSCLGPKGIRIEQIKKELHGEIVDILEWSDDPEVLIANAIGPDIIEKVYLTEKGRFARIIVSEENKNLAIGKLGKNVRLAAKVTDYKLDIFTKEEFEEKIAEERRITSHVNELDGVSSKIAEILKDHGYTSVQDIYKASIQELTHIDGIGEKIAEKIKESAKHF